MLRLPSLIALSAALLLAAAPAQALTLGQAAQVAQSAPQAAFNTLELVAYRAESQVPQWSRVKEALSRDRVALQNCINSESHCTGQSMQGWRAMILQLRNQDQQTQLDMVNGFFNRWQYRSDAEIYNVSEYWASPLEFMANSGDCEDYAIAKYVTLQFLGYNDNDMRIMAVVDNNRGGIGHSVLSVNTNNGKVILDNLNNRAYADSQQTGYAPRFAVNQTGIYTYAQQPQLVMASYQP